MGVRSARSLRFLPLLMSTRSPYGMAFLWCHEKTPSFTGGAIDLTLPGANVD